MVLLTVGKEAHRHAAATTHVQAGIRSKSDHSSNSAFRLNAKSHAYGATSSRTHSSADDGAYGVNTVVTLVALPRDARFELVWRGVDAQQSGTATVHMTGDRSVEVVVARQRDANPLAANDCSLGQPVSI